MEPFKIIQKEFIPEFNLELYGNMLNKRETLHNEAVKASSELKQAIAQLNLNESEEGFRQQLVADVENTINDNSTLGDYAASYDDMIKLSGDIVSNPKLLGRLKAQKDYETFQSQIDAMQMPDNYKKYFKDKNPYKYNETVDAGGNVIKIDKWQPNINPTQLIDYNDVIKQALNYFTPNQSKTQVVRYQKADGTFTTDLEPGTKAVYYDTVTSQITEITETDLKNAIDAAIKANPKILASLEQDRQVAIYDLENGNIPLYKVSNGTSTLTLNQFKDEIFKPFIDAKKEKIVLQEREQNKNYYKDYAAMFGNNNADEPYSGESIIGPLVEFTDYSSAQSINNVKEGNNKLKNRFTQLTGIENPSISIKDKNSYLSQLSKLSIFDNIPKELLNDREDLIEYIDTNKIDKGSDIIDFYDKLLKEFDDYQILYAEDIYNENKIIENETNEKSLGATYFKSDILLGDTWDETSENYRSPINEYEENYRNAWKSVINKVLPNNAVSLDVEFIQEKAYANFIKAIGSENLLKYGITTKSDGKRKIVSLPKESAQYIEQFAKAVGYAEDNLNMFQREGNIYYVDDNGNKQSIVARQSDLGPIKLTPTGFASSINNFLLNINKISNQSIGQEKYVETFILPGGTTSSTEAQYAIKALDVENPDDMKRLSNLKSAANINDEYILNAIKLSSETNCKIRIFDEESNVLRKADGKEAINFKNLLFNSNNVSNPGIIFLPDEMKYVPYITFVDSDGSVKKMAYDFGNNHRITKDLNNDINLKARSELMLSHGQNKTIKVAGMSYENGYEPVFLHPTVDGGFDIGNNDGAYEDINYHINANDSNRFNVAVEIKTLTDQLNYIKANNIKLTKKGIVNLLNNYVILMSQLMGKSIDELPNNQKINIINGFVAESGIKVNIN